ncbi:MAG: hypothetical protein OXC79_09985 [Candidatus Poribacteria bacterium]|nr:hypothetical protein [Candidatus Poribacteria bacterium]
MRDYAAERFEDGSRALFNRKHPLAEAIMNGWKEHSPVDCLIISPDFELMGRQLVNELYEDSNRRGLPRYEYYLIFLQQALAGKQPGLGNLILTRESPSQEVLDVFRTPTVGYQDYTVVLIDTTDFENGGTLTIDIETGRDEGEGGFCLFDGDSELSTEEKIPKNTLARTWISSGATRQITHRFDRGQLFKLGATGDWDRAEPCVNAFRAIVSVQESSNEGTPSTGLRVVLNSAQSSSEILDIFRAPGNGYQDYTVVNIDTRAFEDGGTLTIYVQVGSADAAGSFDLFESDTELPTEGIPEALASAWGVKPNTATTIHHRFERGEVFKLGATGDWFSKKGDMNAFYLKISAEES